MPIEDIDATTVTITIFDVKIEISRIQFRPELGPLKLGDKLLIQSNGPRVIYSRYGDYPLTLKKLL